MGTVPAVTVSMVKWVSLIRCVFHSKPCQKIPCSFPDLTEALEAAMEHMKEMDWEAILDQEDMNREGFEYIDDDEVSFEDVNQVVLSIHLLFSRNTKRMMESSSNWGRQRAKMDSLTRTTR